jgi:hypothetical protein
MTANIRVAHAGALVTGATPAATISAAVTVTSSLPLGYSATITAPVNVASPGLTPTIRVAHAWPLLTAPQPAAAIQAAVTVVGALSGVASGAVIRVAYAGALAAVQDTAYWSGTAWVDGTASAFIQAPVSVTAPAFTPPPATNITFPVKVASTFVLARDITIAAALEPDAYRATLEAGPYTIILEETVPRTIRTSIGDTAYVSVLITEIMGKDISASSFQISLGSPNAPGAWLTPTVVEAVNPSAVRLKLLVGTGGTSVAAGRYRPWGRIVDTPETESVMSSDLVTIA